MGGQGAFDFKATRDLATDRLERLDDAERERLGLSDCETIFASRAARTLRAEWLEALAPVLLRSTSKQVEGLEQDQDVEVVPVPPRWADFEALDEAGAIAHLVERVQGKDLALKALQAAAMLGSAAARGALGELGETPLDPPDDARAWCDVIWACGSQAWGFTVAAYLEHALAAGVADAPDQLEDWPGLVRAWLGGDDEAWKTLKRDARWHLNGSGLDRYGNPIDDSNYAAASPDDPHALAVLSLSRRRGFRYQRAVESIGAPEVRQRVAHEALPAVLGCTRFPPSSCPPGTPIAAYDPSATFAVDAWLHHAQHGLGQVVASEGEHVDVVFDVSGKRRLAQAR